MDQQHPEQTPDQPERTDAIPTEPVAAGTAVPTEPVAAGAPVPTEPVAPASAPGPVPARPLLHGPYPLPAASSAAPRPAPYPAPQQPVVDPAFAAAYPQHPGYGPAAPFAVPEPTPRSTRRRRTAVALIASGALAAGLVLGGSAVALGWPDQAGTGLTSSPESGTGSGSGGTTSGGTLPGGTAPGGSGSGQAGGTGTLPGTGSSTTALDTTTATDEQQAGVVLISTVLGYQSAEAAGSGVVLTSDGLVLTNNHVVEGSTEITVTIGTTGESYTAEVVGTDATADVAVLQLQDASGLTTASLDDDGDLAVGDAVTAVGNAEGGGVLMAAAGTVTGLDESITTQAEGSSSGEELSGLIEVDADVVSGDSGGALLDDEGEVVGITTAASSGSADITGYAIPIGDALDVATQILSGSDSDTIQLGYPAFLGVQLATTTQGSTGQGALGGTAGGSLGGATRGGTTSTAGATVAGVIDGTPAAGAGLAAGDTITAVDGVAVADGDALSAALAEHAPGDQVTLSWTTTSGTTTEATVTLIEGPAA